MGDVVMARGTWGPSLQREESAAEHQMWKHGAENDPPDINLAQTIAPHLTAPFPSCWAAGEICLHLETSEVSNLGAG